MNNRSRQKIRAARLMHPYSNVFSRDFAEAVQKLMEAVREAAARIMDGIARAAASMSESVHEWVTDENVQKAIAAIRAQDMEDV